MNRLPLPAFTALLMGWTSVAGGVGTDGDGSQRARSPVVEIRVRGSADAVARVRLTARELLERLEVRADVKAADEPEGSTNGPPPLVVAFVELGNGASASIDVEDGRTRQELTHRSLTDVTSLEAGAEALLHVLYLAVESTLQVGPQVPPPTPRAVEKKPAVPAAAPARPARSRFGVDAGALLRLSSLGGSRFVPGAGAVIEPRVNLGPLQTSLMVSVAWHASSALTFAAGEASVRPLQLRLVPSLDWLISTDIAACWGLGGGLDSLLIEPIKSPELGSASPTQSALDPIVTSFVGGRVPVSARAFLSALASVDVDLAPTSFVAREGGVSRPILALPRLRAGFSLVLSFSAAGAHRFASRRAER